MLKVLNVQSYKGGVRISILCGFRALLEFRKKAAVLSELSAKLSANQEGLGEAVDKLKNTNQAMKAKLAAANEKMMQQKLRRSRRIRPMYFYLKKIWMSLSCAMR